MATEQTPLEPDLREPRRRSREFNALLWLGGWGGAAAIALTALAIASQTKTAGERLRQVFAINEPAAIAQMPPRVTQLEVRRAAFDGTSARTHRRARPPGRPHCATRKQHRRHDRRHQTAGGRYCRRSGRKNGAPAGAERTCHNCTGRQSARGRPLRRAIGRDSNPAALRQRADASNTAAVPMPPTRVATVVASEPAPSASAQNEFGLDLGGAATLDGSPPALDHGESQFRTSAQRHVSARRP